MTDRTFQIIAHRGASADALENTMEAFRLGLEQGADAVECDVHLAADGELVAIHDANTRRVFGVDAAVAELPLAGLKALDDRIPALGEVLAIMPPDRRIFIEIKVGKPALAPLGKLLAGSTLPHGQVVLMEFDFETVLAMKAAFPGTEVLWLNEFPWHQFPNQKTGALATIIETAARHRLDGINLQDIPQLNADVVKACRRNGLKCYCWTVDDPVRAAELVALGVDGIATNRPGWMQAQLGRNRMS